MAMQQKSSPTPNRPPSTFNERRGLWIDYVSERTELTPATRLIGIWLARRMNHRTEDTWYQVSTIAVRIGQTPRNVMRATKALEDAGLLLIFRDGRRGVKKAVNRYELGRLPFQGDENVTPWK